MCDVCKKPPYSFRGTKHEPVACPFKTSQYCSSCAVYGHTLASCPSPINPFYTTPCYMEQLISPALLKQYGIVSTTLLPTMVPPLEDAKQGLIEIRNDDKVIRLFLTARGLMSGRIENPIVLREMMMMYAKTENKRLVYLPCD
jgi:hypothetical protein